MMANQTLYDAGSAFVEAGKEVMYGALLLAGHVPGTAIAGGDASAHLAVARPTGPVGNASAPQLRDSRHWKFMIDNGPTGLATSYLRSLDRMVVRWAADLPGCRVREQCACMRSLGSLAAYMHECCHHR